MCGRNFLHRYRLAFAASAERLAQPREVLEPPPAPRAEIGSAGRVGERAGGGAGGCSKPCFVASFLSPQAGANKGRVCVLCVARLVPSSEEAANRAGLPCDSCLRKPWGGGVGRVALGAARLADLPAPAFPLHLFRGCPGFSAFDAIRRKSHAPCGCAYLMYRPHLLSTPNVKAPPRFNCPDQPR